MFTDEICDLTALDFGEEDFSALCYPFDFCISQKKVLYDSRQLVNVSAQTIQNSEEFGPQKMVEDH